MTPFYGWGSTTSRPEPLQGGSLLFTTKFPEILQARASISFQDLLSFLGKEKSTKSTYFATERCFIHSRLIFVTQSLIISLQHIQLCINLLSQSL